MAQILVRNLDPKTVARLKKHARENRRSLESEVKRVLENASDKMTLAEFRSTAASLRASINGRRQTDSVLLLREDRER